MSLTIPQAFDAKHNARDNVFLYISGGSRSFVNQKPIGETGNPRLNFAGKANLVGAFKDVAIIASNTEFYRIFNGTGVETEGEELLILDPTAATLAKLDVVVSGIYNTAPSMYFRFGVLEPEIGQGNIVITNTNITITDDAGVVTSGAHGQSWQNGDRFMIGCRLSPQSPLIYRVSADADVVSEAFISGSFPLGASITIADEFYFGSTGSPAFVNAAFAGFGRDNLNLIEEMYNRWRVGNFLLPELYNDYSYVR